MVFKRDSKILIVIGICILKFITCLSLNHVLNNSNCLKNYTNQSIYCSPGVLRDAIGNFLEKNCHVKGHEEITTKNAMETLLKDPCILTKIASILDIHKLRIIASRGQTGFEESLSKCNDSIRGNIIKSVAVIQGNENSYENLKRHLLQVLSREINCYIVLCKMVCTSVIMNLAYTLGYASTTYVWISIGQPASKKEMKYPKKWAAISITPIKMSVAKPKLFDLKKEPANIVCYKIKLVTSQDEQYQFQHIPSYLHKDYTTSSEDVIVKELFSYTPKSHFKLSKFFKKEAVKVVAVTRYFHYREDLLDQRDFSCRYGLLCWVYALNNQSDARKRIPNCCQGHVIDILLLLKEDLNVNIHLYEVEDGKYGSINNGAWNGLIGEVVSGRADIAADFLSVTESRMSSVDFCDSFYKEEVVLASKLQFSNLKLLNLELFASVRPQFWAIILTTTFIVSVIIYWSERFINTDFPCETWIQFFLYSIGLLVQRDVGGSIPHCVGSRTVSIVLALAMMIAMTTYVAVLATKNITTKKVLPISGLDDEKAKFPTSSFKIATLKDSAHSQFFERNKNPELRRLGKFMKPHNFDSISEIIEKIQRGSLQAVVIAQSSLSILWNMYDSCDIQYENTISHDQLAFSLKKGFHLKEEISALMRMYRENGKLDVIEKRWLTAKCPQTTGVSQSFGMLYLSGACCMLLLGVILSGGVLIIEHVCFAKNRGRRSSYNVQNSV